MAMKTLRVIPMMVSTSAATTTTATDVDYRFNASPMRSFFVQKSAAAGPSVFIEAAPYDTGPWIALAEVTAACTTTIVRLEFEIPYVRASYAGSGPLVTIYGVF